MLDFLTSNDILWNTVTIDSTQNDKFLVSQRVCSNAVNAGFCLPDCRLLSFRSPPPTQKPGSACCYFLLYIEGKTFNLPS